MLKPFSARSIQRCTLLAEQDLTVMSDLADIETIAHEVEQRSPLEWVATAGAAGPKQPCLGADVTLLDISNQSIDPLSSR
jgi:hypothetical protein